MGAVLAKGSSSSGGTVQHSRITITPAARTNGPLVSAGRAEEFAAMGWSAEVPDPQQRSTFVGSQLRWEERTEGEHGRMLGWYRELIALRRAHQALQFGDGRTPVGADAETVRSHADREAVPHAVRTRPATTSSSKRASSASWSASARSK